MQKSVSEYRKQPEGTLELVEDEAFILVKAAPRRSEKFGETVCCAGVDCNGDWVRLYPVSFRHLEDAQRFGRWDHIRYRWSKPKASKDSRQESRRVDPCSIEIVKKLKPSDRNPLANRCLVTSLKKEHAAKRSLALLQAEIEEFWYQKKSDEELADGERVLATLRSQAELFAPSQSVLPTRTCTYSFHYRYRDDDGLHTGTCQDWETEQTFFRQLCSQPSEQDALDWMVSKFGKEYPEKGMALAMGTHRYRLDQWLINGIIRIDPEPQAALL